MVTLVAVTHPWMCDTMGHVNTRHYAALFDDASLQLLAHLAGPDGAGPGWADVHWSVEFRREVLAGAPVMVRSFVTALGRTSLTYRHVLTGSRDQAVHAEATITSVRFDLALRAKVPLEPEVRQRAEALMADAAS